MEHAVEPIFGGDPLVKGSVYEMARKCGNPSCRCTRGQLHKSIVLSWSHQGKTRLMSLPAERIAELRAKSEEYQRFRKARARVAAISKELLSVIDRMEKLRREQP
ncbi:MAG TPA: hypothetical protein DCP92_00970 [Nitrospiraceae bacterium]|jgi:hypothetical protein|nr:hypothetical protein [Nitrospiraceae bacterium]